VLSALFILAVLTSAFVFSTAKAILIHLLGPFSAVPDTEMVGFSSGTIKFQPYTIVN